jgi:hypothetical protein
MIAAFFDFIKSDLGLAISWFCGVVGFAYGLFQKKETQRVRIAMNVLINQTKIKKASENLAVVDGGGDSVSQVGDKNIYTKTNSGGMHIKM